MSFIALQAIKVVITSVEYYELLSVNSEFSFLVSWQLFFLRLFDKLMQGTVAYHRLSFNKAFTYVSWLTLKSSSYSIPTHKIRKSVKL
jgi:hypothetical protein